MLCGRHTLAQSIHLIHQLHTIGAESVSVSGVPESLAKKSGGGYSILDPKMVSLVCAVNGHRSALAGQLVDHRRQLGQRNRGGSYGPRVYYGRSHIHTYIFMLISFFCNVKCCKYKDIKIYLSRLYLPYKNMRFLCDRTSFSSSRHSIL
jgi:hypothetical protein